MLFAVANLARVHPERSLDDIAVSIRSNFEQAQQGALTTLDASLAVGSDLYEARRQLSSDTLFGKWLTAQQFPFKQKWAWILIEASKHERDVRSLSSQLLSEGKSINIEKAVSCVRQGVHYSSESPEWYTPKDIIKRTIATLGAIDIDPCSDEKGTVPAARHFTKDNDGLKRDWKGRVYMNPPYGKDIQPWIEKLCGEYLDKRTTEAIALVPARVDTAWFRMLRDFPVCFVSGRLKFSGHDNSAPFPSAVFYLGKRPEAFFAAFSDLGDVWMRWQPA